MHYKTKRIVIPFGSIQPVWVPYPTYLRAQVELALEQWKKFCQRPLEIKNRFVFEEIAGIGDAGYEFRPGDVELKIDKKESLHFTKGESERLLSYTDRDMTSDDGRAFILTLQRLEKECFPFIIKFAEYLVQEFPSLPIDFVEKITASRNRWTYRFLHYFPGENDIIGGAHCDKGGFTPHLASDMPGLEYLASDKKTWLPMDSTKGSTVIIPSLQLQYVSRGKVKALCHRVISTPESRLHGRYSSVCFIDMMATALYNKKHFGGTQIHPPGFNYDMPKDDFNKMFV
jgi:isopenicillin N synthase-like dioxygenase